MHYVFTNRCFQLGVEKSISIFPERMCMSLPWMNREKRQPWPSTYRGGMPRTDMQKGLNAARSITHSAFPRSYLLHFRAAGRVQGRGEKKQTMLWMWWMNNSKEKREGGGGNGGLRKRKSGWIHPASCRPFYTPEIHLIHSDMSNPPEKGEDSIFVYVFV